MELAQSVITFWEFEFYLNNIDKWKLTQKQQQTREIINAKRQSIETAEPQSAPLIEKTVVPAASTPPIFSQKRQPAATREKARNGKLWFSGN